jgi:hypothetical protein
MICPICGADRPEEVHLDWCDYEGPEPEGRWMTETIGKGDIVWFTHTSRVTKQTTTEWAVVSGRSSLNSRVIFARDSKGRARCIHTGDVTRVQRKESA